MSSRTKVRAGTVRVNPMTSTGIRAYEVEGELTFTIIEGELAGIEIKFQMDRKERIVRSVLSSWQPNIAFALDPKRAYRTRLIHRGSHLEAIEVMAGDRTLRFSKITV